VLTASSITCFFSAATASRSERGVRGPRVRAVRLGGNGAISHFDGASRQRVAVNCDDERGG
jgi:hypothetical protein